MERGDGRDAKGRDGERGGLGLRTPPPLKLEVGCGQLGGCKEGCLLPGRGGEADFLRGQLGEYKEGGKLSVKECKGGGYKGVRGI